MKSQTLIQDSMIKPRLDHLSQLLTEFQSRNKIRHLKSKIEPKLPQRPLQSSDQNLTAWFNNLQLEQNVYMEESPAELRFIYLVPGPMTPSEPVFYFDMSIAKGSPLKLLTLMEHKVFIRDRKIEQSTVKLVPMDFINRRIVQVDGK